MAINQKQVLSLQQKLSPQQIQMIKLLELPTVQLEQRIKQEIEDNIVLEEEERAPEEEEQPQQISVDEYLRGDEPQNRGGMGLKNYQVTEKTGPVCAVKVVNEDEDLLVISDDGTIIRLPVSDVSVYGRQTQGVRLMKVADGSRVISIARTEHEEEEEN